tara:strand:+ start:12270 stop:13553 length:1284 start_codon:yes stop_codon:yes gene_type:complete
MSEVIGYIGMTHLGLNSAAGALSRGADVLCFDPNTALIERIRQGELPVSEPDLAETFAAHGDRLMFSSVVEDLAACDVVYVAPDVATDDAGGSDLSNLLMLLEIAETHVPDCAVLVVLSQVPPGFTRPRASARRHYYYQVETLVFGIAVQRAREPERFIVGCADPSQSLPEAFQRFLARFECPILPMRFESAELAKIAINCFLVAQVSTTNTLAEICENTGADWSEIAPALRLDARIGQKAYLKPGLGIAGGNLERDLACMVSMGEKFATDVGVIRAEIANSGHRKGAAARMFRDQVLPHLGQDATVAVWGLAYKENTHSIKNSPSLATLAAFPSNTFQVHDPVVQIKDTGMSNLQGHDDPFDALAGADCLMILTPWDVYRAATPDRIASKMRGRFIIDPYAVLDAAAARTCGLRLMVLGKPVLEED